MNIPTSNFSEGQYSLRQQQLAAVKKRQQCRMHGAGLFGDYETADSPLGRDLFAKVLNGRGAYLWGRPGRGKTYAAACCVRRMIERDYPAKMMTSKDFLDAIKGDWGTCDDGRTFARATKYYKLFVLDDLGMENTTPWSMETITSFIDNRVSLGLPVIFTSNYSLGDLREKWGETAGARIASRIAGSCDRLFVDGTDRRIKDA